MIESIPSLPLEEEGKEKRLNIEKTKRFRAPLQLEVGKRMGFFLPKNDPRMIERGKRWTNPEPGYAAKFAELFSKMQNEDPAELVRRYENDQETLVEAFVEELQHLEAVAS